MRSLRKFTFISVLESNESSIQISFARKKKRLKKVKKNKIIGYFFGRHPLLLFIPVKAQSQVSFKKVTRKENECAFSNPKKTIFMLITVNKANF